MDSDQYLHRGFMLDTGRKFFPVDAILGLLSVLAQYNFNVFHWHIYDSESFPVHLPEFPDLVNTSIQHSHTTDFYTPGDIRNVIDYAQNLGILVYPETDMPGHCDIWGLWKDDLVVGTANVSDPEAQLDITKRDTYEHITTLISGFDKYFVSPLHHFGGDEVAYMWDSKDDNKLFETFLQWLRNLRPDKTMILWDDPLTDEEKRIRLSRDWIIQTWHDGVTQDILDKGHRVIVSEAASFYIGNASADTISNFSFPADPNVLGFEVVWFTSTDDDPYDWKKDWVMEPIKAAASIRKSSNNDN